MIAENTGTVIVSGLFSFALALLTYYGIVRRVEAEETIASNKAVIDATKAEKDLDLKLSERVDRLRAKLWEDVEDKMAKQAERIVKLEAGKVADQERIATLEKTVIELRKMLERKEEENGRLRKENARLRSEGNDYKPASL